jgi:hypothetical protein
MAVRSVGAKGTPAAQLKALIEKCDPRHQSLIRSVRSALRKRLPTANELVYDYPNSLVISYSPSEHGIEGIVSTAARPSGVDLYFNQGNRLPDPKKLLMGSGRQVRFIHVEAASRLAHPDVKTLIAAAIKASGVPLPSTGGGKLIIRTDAAKKRPRRKPAK